MKKHWHQLIGVAIGVAITPMAAWLAILSGGAGHGSYVLAKLLFPYSMLLTRFANDTISLPLIGLALIQFPLYGLATTSFTSRRHTRQILAALALLHAIGAYICFSGFLPNY